MVMKWFTAALDIGALPSDPPDIRRRKRLFILAVGCMLVQGWVIAIPMMIARELLALCVIPVTVGAAVSVAHLRYTGTTASFTPFFMLLVFVYFGVHNLSGGYSKPSVVPIYLTALAHRHGGLLDWFVFGTALIISLAVEFILVLPEYHVSSKTEVVITSTIMLCMMANHTFLKYMFAGDGYAPPPNPTSTSLIEVIPKAGVSLPLQLVSASSVDNSEMAAVDDCIAMLTRNTTSVEAREIVTKLRAFRKSACGNSMSCGSNNGSKGPTRLGETRSASESSLNDSLSSVNVPSEVLQTTAAVADFDNKYRIMKVMAKAADVLYLRVERRATVQRYNALHLSGIVAARYRNSAMVTIPPKPGGGAVTHPNISQRVDMYTRETEIILVYEECDTNFLKLMRKRSIQQQYFHERKLLPWCIQVLSAIHYFHETLQICHGDITPSNTSVGNDNLVVLGDMFITKAWKEKDTFELAPPEFKGVAEDSIVLTKASDMWWVGMWLYCVATLQLPFQELSHAEAEACVRRGDFPRIPSCYSDTFGQCIFSLLNPNPAQRPTIVQLLKQPLWQSAAHLLRQQGKPESTINYINKVMAISASTSSPTTNVLSDLGEFDGMTK